MAAGNERWSRFWVASKASTNQLKYIEIYWNLLWPSEIMWNRFPPLNSLWTFTHLTPVPGSCWDFAAGSSRWWSLTRKMKRSTFQRGWYLAKRWGLEAVSHRSSTTGGFFGFLGPKHMTKEVCFDKVYRVYRSTGSQDNHWSKPDLYTIQTIHFVWRKVHCPTRLGGESNQFTI